MANVDFMLGAGCSDEELSAVAAWMVGQSSDELWEGAEWPEQAPPAHINNQSSMAYEPLPKGLLMMSAGQFRSVALGLGLNASAAAANSVFNAMAGGNSGWAKKMDVQKAIDEWSSNGGAFNSGAFQLSLLFARAQVGFGLFWLYGVSTFCGYFFFIRPPLFDYTGIDLLPGQPMWWK